MFKIKYRIVDDFEELKMITGNEFDQERDQITGYFQWHFGTYQEGYYCENSLEEGEVGDELLEYWFESFLKVVILLKTGFDHVAFHEIEFADRWLAFEKTGDKVTINIVEDQKHESKSQLVTEHRYFVLLEALNDIVLFKDFENEVFDNAKKFIDEVALLNLELKKTDMYSRIKTKIERIEELNHTC